MTFLSKPSLVIKKTPLIEGKCEEEVVEMSGMEWGGGEPRLSLVSVLCMTVVAFMVTLLGITTGFLIYRHYVRTTTIHRYQGFCTIPIKDPALYEPNYRVMPLRWSAEPSPPADDALNALQEELDIGDSVERILVTDNGRRVNFIHDFEANLTGIVDAERCFMMDLEPELALSPELFVLSIEGGGAFDVSRVRSTLRAALPALAAVARQLADRCADRPVYHLLKDDSPAIRKRSVDAPPHDYMVFAGRHIHEIEITNLAELLQQEQRN